MGEVLDNIQSYDVIIIGAGINGAGIASDAALRNLRVLLLDKDDIASGTSSRSTRLIHGGLRYLEHGEVSLVRESLRERETLLHIAPHLVKPLPILVPIYRENRRSKTAIQAGMLAYDVLSFDRSLPRHKMLSRDAVIQLVPGLNGVGLKAGALFYDAQVEFAERLVLENVLSAVEHGATLITHAEIKSLIVEQGQISSICYLVDRSSDVRTAHAKVFINAAGPWVDEVLGLAGYAEQPLIGGTKGSHLVVPSFPDAPKVAIYFEALTDRRPFFIIPWNDNYLIGTTDIRFAGDLDQVRIEEREVDYLLSETNRIFPRANLTASNILYSYSGVRPLPLTDLKDEQRITRRHFIREHKHLTNLLSIVGGKLTTYRSLSEQAVDLVFRKLGRPIEKCVTATTLLPGARRLREVEEMLREQRGSLPAAERLLRIYGSRALQLLELATRNQLSTPLSPNTTALSGEVIFAFEREFAHSLTDCLLRRTMLGLEADLALGEVEVAARIAQCYLGWSTDRARSEVLNYRNYLEKFRISH